MIDTSIIHPILVHFPIALTLLGCLLEGLALIKKCPLRCGEIILYFAAVSAIFAAVAGNLFTINFTKEELIQAKDMHGAMAGITVVMLCIASFFYILRYSVKRYELKLRYAGFAFYLLGAVFVGITGYFGGVIVYNDLLGL